MSRAILFAVCLLAAVVRFQSIGAHGIWHDERLSLSSAVGSTLDEPLTEPRGTFTPGAFWASATLERSLKATLAQDSGNGFLFVLLLRGWISIVGTEDAAVRALPATLGVLCVYLLYHVALRVSDQRIALLAALLCAFHPLLVRYSRELRPYTMATALSLCATLCLIDVFQKGYRASRSILWGLIAASAFLTHYLTVYVLAAQFVFALLQGRRLQVAIAVATLTALCPVGIWLLGPGGLGLETMAAQQETYALRAATELPGENFAMPPTPRNVAAGWLQCLMGMSGNGLQATGARLLTLAPLFTLPVLLVCNGLRLVSRQKPSEALLTTMLSFAGLLVATALSLRAGHIIPFQVPYMNFGVPYLMILLAAGFSPLGDRQRPFRSVWLAAAGGVVFLAVSSTGLVYYDTPLHRPKNPYLSAARWTKRWFRPGDEVRYTSWQSARMVNVYFLPSDTIVQTVAPSQEWNGALLLHRGRVERRFDLPR